jgi:recombination protein RecA
MPTPTAVRLAQADDRPPATADRDQQLTDAMRQVDHHLGPGVVTHPDPSMIQAAVPTGSLPVDLAIGVGGIPRGRITEIYGPEGAGKTTLALSVIAQAQRAGGTACFVDAEHALDLAWAATVGVDPDRLVICRPECGEQALQVADLLVGSGALDVLVVDSVAALVPRAELDGAIGDRHAGVQANLLSQALRRLCGQIARAGVAVLVTNQLRERAGTPGAPTYTAGGRALGYYASVRLDLRLLETLRDGDRVLGSRVRVTVTKNKVAPAWQTADLDVLADRGISFEAGLLDLGVHAGLVSRSGGWYAYGEVRLGQGRAHASRSLAEQPEVAHELEARLRARLGPADPTAQAATA